MNAATSAVVTGLIVVAGRWADKDTNTGVDVNLAVAVTTYAIVLSLLESINEKFAGQFALFVMVSAAFHSFSRVKGIKWA